MTDKEIARLSAPVLQAYRDMEDELLRMIARQIGKDKRVSDTSKWMISHLARAGEVNRQALMIIDSYAGGVDAECAEAILAAAEGEVGTLDEAMLSLLSEPGEMTEDVQQALDAFSRQGRQELAVQDARIAEPYAQALTERCNMVNTVMGYSAMSAYNNAVREIARNAGEIDRSAVLREMNAGAASVVMGTESIQQATRQTIHRMAEKGLPGFVDKAGRQWSPEAYVRMDLRTTMGNTARAAQDARCDEWGIQLIEVSSHNGARPKCAPYQGRIFSRDGSRGVTRDLDGNQIEYIPLSETSYGEPDGLFGINCGHQQYPFIPGVSVRSYYPYPEEENAERYQQMQQQRAMERKIRDDKRECMMLQETGDEEGLKKAAGKLRADRDRYKDFCKETGLGAHNENTQVYGYDRSKSMKTVWAGRTNGSRNVGNAADGTGAMVGRAPSAGVSTMAAPAGATANYVPYNLTGSGGSGIINRDSSFDFYPVSNDVLQKGINFNVFNNDELNSSVEAGMMEILNTVSPFTPGTEAGLTIKLSDHTRSDIILGVIGSGTIDIPERDYAYLSIHNHASGETFSFGDIAIFNERNNCKYSCIIGNNGRIYVLEKTDSYDRTSFYEKIMRRRLGFEPYINNDERDFIKECEEYGIRYYERGYPSIS